MRGKRITNIEPTEEELSYADEEDLLRELLGSSEMTERAEEPTKFTKKETEPIDDGKVTGRRDISSPGREWECDEIVAAGKIKRAGDLSDALAFFERYKKVKK